MFATVSCLKVNTNTTTKHEKGQKKMALTGKVQAKITILLVTNHIVFQNPCDILSAIGLFVIHGRKSYKFGTT